MQPSSQCPTIPDSLATSTRDSASALRQSGTMTQRFGPGVDVRKRGALRLSPRTDRAALEQPAVVRIWNGEHCRELSAHDARALAAQLTEAAAYVERQNGN